MFDSASTAAQNGVESEGDNEEYTLMSIDTIINGKARFFHTDSRDVFCSLKVVVQPSNADELIMNFYICFQEGVFQGLIPILNCYLENMEVDVDTRCTILNYLKLIKKRASGMQIVSYKLCTAMFPLCISTTQDLLCSNESFSRRV